MNTVSGRIVLTTWAGRVIVPRRERDGDEVAVGTCRAVSASIGCISHNGSGYWATSAGDAAGLGTRQVLRDDPTGGEQHRVVVVDDLGRQLVRHRVEAGLAVGKVELAAFVQPWGAGMAGLGDRPEQTHLVFDPLPRRAGVVGGAAAAGAGTARRRSPRCSCTGSTRSCRAARRCRAGSPSRDGPRRAA